MTTGNVMRTAVGKRRITSPRIRARRPGRPALSSISRSVRGEGRVNPPPPKVAIGPVRVDNLSERQAVQKVLGALDDGRGGVLVNPNLKDRKSTRLNSSHANIS